MKKHFLRKLAIIAVFCGIGHAVDGQTPATHHVGLSVCPNYSVLFMKSTNTNLGFIKSQWSGLEMTFRGFYQLERGRFLFQTGVEYAMDISKTKFYQSVLVGTYNQFYEANSLLYTNHFINIPIQLGGRFYQRNRFSISAYRGIAFAFQIGTTTDAYSNGKRTNSDFQSINNIQIATGISPSGIIINIEQLKFVMSSTIFTGLAFEYQATPNIMLSAAPQIGIPFFGLRATDQSGAKVQYPTLYYMTVGFRLQVSFQVQSKKK